jgi:murein DD-endopeptidase MepM/ murein hydrolase activator NlpD
VSETYREGRVNYEAQPVYIAQADAPIVNDPIQTLPGQVTVLPGDTVYAISRRTGASPQSIIALNSLQAPYTLTVGQTVRVPSNAVPPSQASIAAPPAPVHAVAATREAAHIVRPGDTLYSISRSTGVGVSDLARANNLRAPYSISIGQALRIPGGVSVPAQREASAPAASGDVADIARTVSYEAPPPKKPALFDWPVQGAIIGSYGLSTAGKRNDGVNIAAPVGTPVRAAADGEVVYRGSELDGYGNLILIKHEDGFVTAYAHNDAMLVKKGDRVRQGQVIAKVGQTGSASEPQLHFEIRQNLKAVDPVALLGSL